MIYYPNEDTFENKRVKVRVNNCPVIKGKPGLCQVHVDVHGPCHCFPMAGPSRGLSQNSAPSLSLFDS